MMLMEPVRIVTMSFNVEWVLPYLLDRGASRSNDI